jgi:hypothetical protein
MSLPAQSVARDRQIAGDDPMPPEIWITTS